MRRNPSGDYAERGAHAPRARRLRCSPLARPLVAAILALTIVLTGCTDEGGSETLDPEEPTIIGERDGPEAAHANVTNSNPLAHARHGEHAAHAQLDMDCDMGGLVGWPEKAVARRYLPEGVEPFTGAGILASRVAAAGEESTLAVLFVASCVERSTGTEVSYYGIAIAIDVDWASRSGSSDIHSYYMVDVGLSGEVREHVEAFGFPVRDISTTVSVTSDAMTATATDGEGPLASIGTQMRYIDYDEAKEKILWYMTEDGQWIRIDNVLDEEFTGEVGTTTDCELRGPMQRDLFVGGTDCMIESTDAATYTNAHIVWHFEMVPDPREPTA